VTAADRAELEACQVKVERLRLDFPILNRPLTFGGHDRPLVYLDNANTTQKPEVVIDAVVHYYENANANVSRAIHSLGEESTRIYEGARDRVKAFLNAAHREEMIFTKGTTEAINLVATSFCRLLTAGDEILLTEMEHHANLVPWQMEAEARGLVLKFLPFDAQGVLELDQLPGLLTPRTRLVAVTAMSNVLGTINPVAEIIRQAHAQGVPVLVDAAQAAPHQKLDVQALDCDFLAFSSHKMGGPTGMGVLYGKKAWLEKLPPYHGGGNMIRSVWLDRFEPNVLPFKFEAGTPHMEGAAGLTAALDYLGEVGLDWIARYERLLADYALERLAPLAGLRVLGAAPDRGIAVRAGHHCAHPLARKLGVVSSARASFWFYNTMAEAEAFAAAVLLAAESLS